MFTTTIRNAIAGPSRLATQSNAVSRRPISNPFIPILRSSLPSLSIPSTPFRPFSASTPTSDKLKSHSGTKKRFFRTASGLFKRAQAGKAHLNTMFSAKRINRLGKTAYTTKTQAKMLRKLLPYA